MVDHINEEAVKDVAEQDVTSGTVDSYEDRVAGVAETIIDELTSGAIEQYNTPVKEMNAPVEPAQTYVQHGRGAYSGKSDTVAEKARDALSRSEWYFESRWLFRARFCSSRQFDAGTRTRRKRNAEWKNKCRSPHNHGYQAVQCRGCQGGTRKYTVNPEQARYVIGK